MAEVPPVHPVCLLMSNAVCAQGGGWVSPQSLPVAMMLCCDGYHSQITQGPAVLLWDSGGRARADLGGGNFIQAEVKNNV